VEEIENGCTGTADVEEPGRRRSEPELHQAGEFIAGIGDGDRKEDEAATMMKDELNSERRTQNVESRRSPF
jgi:hypothetical protein